MHNIVDVTYTVKASVAKGRRLMRDLVSGKEFWVEDESDTAEQPLPKKKGGKRREKKLEI
jgi:hypothetical protein